MCVHFKNLCQCLPVPSWLMNEDWEHRSTKSGCSGFSRSSNPKNWLLPLLRFCCEGCCCCCCGGWSRVCSCTTSGCMSSLLGSAFAPSSEINTREICEGTQSQGCIFMGMSNQHRRFKQGLQLCEHNNVIKNSMGVGCWYRAISQLSVGQDCYDSTTPSLNILSYKLSFNIADTNFNF